MNAPRVVPARLPLLLLAALAMRVACSQSLAGPLKPATLDDPRGAPLAAELPLGPSPSPRDTVTNARLRELLQPLCTLVDNGRLQFRSAPDAPPTTLLPAKPRVVTVADGTAARAVLLYAKHDNWYACPAALLRFAPKKGVVVEFLDADLDGSYFGDRDFVRHGASAFRAVDADRLLLLDDVLGRYEVDAAKARLTIQRLPWPKWASPEQRFGAMVVADCRQIGGLPPMQLDEDRSRVCAWHAQYLFLNGYSFATSVRKTHAEEAGLPGYSKEGASAAPRVVMTFSGDMMEAVTAQFWTMLHRGSFLGDASPGLGVAVKLGSSVPGVPGYTVFWGNRAPAQRTTPLVFPAPGATGSARFCALEAPGVEDDPRFYDSQRGLAVSVTYGELPLTKIRFELFEDGARKPTVVRGRTFSHEAPVSRTFDPDNGRSAFFVAEQMLKAATWHTASFTADVAGSTVPLRLVWSFQTQP
jgi:hypothetical protein